jgi:hypothetical protein
MARVVFYELPVGELQARQLPLRWFSAPARQLPFQELSPHLLRTARVPCTILNFSISYQGLGSPPAASFSRLTPIFYPLLT